VLLAMGISPERARGSLRLSLHRQTTEEEIARTIELISSQVARLRELSAVTQ
jgi:cysteine desulfurase